MPVKYEVAQGEEDWFLLRLGIPTASEFSNIMTAKTQALSRQATSYADLKIAEIMLGETQGIVQPTYWMERGALLELEAREAYEFVNDVKVDRGGFITTDDGYIGCSPDFLVGNDGVGEIKCLAGKNHVTHLIEQTVKSDHIPQIQGQLYVSEREWCDWWMYHPELPRVGIRTYRDDSYIKKLAQCLNDFRDLMNERIERLQKEGNWRVAESLKPLRKGNGDTLKDSILKSASQKKIDRIVA